MSYTKEEAWELSLLALCAWREARNQGLEGMRAVCWTVHNRVVHPSWWGDSYCKVIEKDWQYSSFNESDPNSHKLPGDPAADSSWAFALQAAEEVYLGTIEDSTLGATHYFAVSMTPPPWVRGAEFKVQIGEHRFYRAS